MQDLGEPTQDTVKDQTSRQQTPVAEVTPAIVVSLGSQRPSRIRQLKQGMGRLMDDVNDVVQQVQSSLGEQADGKVFVPVVLIYRRRKRNRQRGGLGLWPFRL